MWSWGCFVRMHSSFMATCKRWHTNIALINLLLFTRYNEQFTININKFTITNTAKRTAFALSFKFSHLYQYQYQYQHAGHLLRQLGHCFLAIGQYFFMMHFKPTERNEKFIHSKLKTKLSIQLKPIQSAHIWAKQIINYFDCSLLLQRYIEHNMWSVARHSKM